MPLTTIFYIIFLISAVIAGVCYHPVIGVYAYLITYNINPMGHWWGSFVPDFGTRYAMLLSIAIGAGFFIHHAKLKYGRFFYGQEIILLLFIGIMWMSLILGHGQGFDYNIGKMTKISMILFMTGHIITNIKQFKILLWVLIFSALYLSFELYSGAGTWQGGRFDTGVGGSDFSEGNFLAAHFGYILPFIGIFILKGNWKVRAACMVAAVFIVNGIILTRSRGIFVALAVAGIASLFLSVRLKKYRSKMMLLLIIGLVGAIQLSDESFRNRMESLQVNNSERDASALNRLHAWDGAWQMVKDYPLGVGAGNFSYYIGNYYPEISGRDTHNTYLRCLAELGFHGFMILMILIINALRMLMSINALSETLPVKMAGFFHLYAFACMIALIVYLVAAMFISSIYIEEFYWILLFPVFLKRALDNAIEENLNLVATEKGD